jgi:DNA-binding NarL/FixJ family response regulator
MQSLPRKLDTEKERPSTVPQMQEGGLAQAIPADETDSECSEAQRIAHDSYASRSQARKDLVAAVRAVFAGRTWKW